MKWRVGPNGSKHCFITNHLDQHDSGIIIPNFKNAKPIITAQILHNIKG